MPESPCEASEDGSGKNYSWDAWVAGLAVLVTATSDTQNAAHCISYFDAHLAVTKWLVLHVSRTESLPCLALMDSQPEA